MASVIACPGCSQQLTLPEGVAPRTQLRCPSCQATMTVPEIRRPVVLPAAGNSASTVVARPHRTDVISKPLVASQGKTPQKPASATGQPASKEPIQPERPVVKRKKKKKERAASGGNRSKMLIIGGGLLMTVTLLTLIFVFVPFGKMFASTPEAQIVDVYTAVNAMGYNNVGVRVMNSDTTAFCIPGPRKIMIARPNPQGQFLLLRLKVPYSELEAFFPGARGRLYLNGYHVQIEANGETRDALFIQDDNAESGHFQLSYQPPNQEGVKVSLRDYLCPKPDSGWTHQGSTKEYEEGITFEDGNGMQVKISVGAERQDGGGGNVLESLTGKKILGNQQGLTGGVAGYVHVDWNPGSAGYIVHSDLEQPNEIGLNWKVNCLVQLPKNAGNEVMLKVLGKSRKLKIR